MVTATRQREVKDIVLTSTFNKLMDAWLSGKRRVFLEGGTWSSKCLGQGTRLVMSDLTLKKVEEIRVGDKLMGIDGKPRNVLKLYSGQDDLYRVKQARGIDYTISSNHILSLRENWKEIRKSIPDSGGTTRQRRQYVRNDHSFEVVNLSVQDYLAKSGKWRRRHKGWKLDGVELKEMPIKIEPYFLGLWLGDGTSGTSNITNSDAEVIEYLKWFAVRRGLRYVKANTDPYGHRLSKTSGKSNPLWDALRGYGVIDNKRIPQEYLNNSKVVRLELLAGLVDSDGYRTKRNTLAITQVRKELAEDILLLVRSLGCYATFNNFVAKMKRKDGSIYETPCYRVEFVGEVLNQLPVKLERKRVYCKPLPRRYASSITIEPEGIGDYFGFEIDGDHLFLLEDFTVTHNTYSAMQLLKFILENYKEPILCTVTSESMPHLKRGAMRDWLKIMGDELIEANWNRTDFIYTYPKSNCLMEYVSADQPAKLKGGRREILFCNEVNNIARDSYREADMRTRVFTICDWNPVSEFWVHDEHLADEPGNVYIHTVYTDTPEVVPQTQRENIESYKVKDPNWWNIYGLGLLGKIEGLVYPHFEQVDELPKGAYFYGLDFGFSSDPTVLIRNVLIGDKLYSQEMFTDYTALTNGQISQKFSLVGVGKGEPIYPDPDEPKSAEELRQMGWNIREPVKGKGSVEFGIQKVNNYYQFWTKDSLEAIKAQRNHRYIKDRVTGLFTDRTTHQWSHWMDARRYPCTTYQGAYSGGEAPPTRNH